MVESALSVASPTIREVWPTCCEISEIEADSFSAAPATVVTEEEAFSEALEKYPDGDTVPEATFRLAFSHYLDGDTQQAIEVATALGELPLTWDATYVEAGRYWAARWLWRRARK